MDIPSILVEKMFSSDPTFWSTIFVQAFLTILFTAIIFKLYNKTKEQRKDILKLELSIFSFEKNLNNHLKATKYSLGKLLESSNLSIENSFEGFRKELAELNGQNTQTSTYFYTKNFLEGLYEMSDKRDEEEDHESYYFYLEGNIYNYAVPL